MLINQILALGDEVEFSLNDVLGSNSSYSSTPHYPHEAVYSQIQAKPSNCMQFGSSFFLVIAKNYPITPIGMIDRMLIACLSGKVTPFLIINKSDEEEDLHPEIQQIYTSLGVSVVYVSAKTSDGLESLKLSSKVERPFFSDSLVLEKAL